MNCMPATYRRTRPTIHQFGGAYRRLADVLHPHVHGSVPVVTAASSVAIGVTYAMTGHPAGLLWGPGVAVFVLSPDIFDRTIGRPMVVRPSHRTTYPHWYYLSWVVGFALLASVFPIAWIYNVGVSDRYSSASTPFRKLPFLTVVVFVLSSVGAVAGALVTWAWARDTRRAMRESSKLKRR